MNDSSPARDIHATFLDEDMEWAAKARCALYASMGGKFLWTSDDRRDQEKAKELCLDCPAFSGCQAFVTRNRVKLCGAYAGIYYPHRNDALGATKVCPWCLEEKPLYEFKKRKETRQYDVPLTRFESLGRSTVGVWRAVQELVQEVSSSTCSVQALFCSSTPIPPRTTL